MYTLCVAGYLRTLQETDDFDEIEGVDGRRFHRRYHSLCHFGIVLENRSVELRRGVCQAIRAIVNCLLAAMIYLVDPLQTSLFIARMALARVCITASRAAV